MRSRLETFAVTLLFAAAPALCEPAQESYDEDWAFTEIESGSDGEFVGRYDPRSPQGDRWTLVSIDGREPTLEEARRYADRKHGENGEDDHESDSDIDGMVEPGSLELIEETDDYWLLRFVPTDDSDDDDMGRKVLERMDGTVKIVKDGHYLEYLDIRNTKPIRPKVGVKMKKFLTRITFGPAIDGGPIVMKSMDVAIKLSAFLVVRVDETESVRFSDFEYAGRDD
jgi:hypothetical protein